MRGLLDVDTALFHWVAGWPRGPVLDSLMLFVSFVGDHAAIWLLIAFACALAWRGPYAMAAWRLALAVGLSGLLVSAMLKPVLARTRPFDAIANSVVVGTRPLTPSFPSGHAANAVAGACALTLVWPRPRAVWWTLATLVAVSRVYLGVHYPLDVAFGALVGWCAARVATASTPAVP